MINKEFVTYIDYAHYIHHTKNSCILCKYSHYIAALGDQAIEGSIYKDWYGMAFA